MSTISKDNPTTRDKRPILYIPYSLVEVMLEVIAVIGLIVLIIYPIVLWPELPDQIPSHFGALGIPDAWSSKMSIWLLPGMGGFFTYY